MVPFNGVLAGPAACPQLFGEEKYVLSVTGFESLIRQPVAQLLRGLSYPEPWIRRLVAGFLPWSPDFSSRPFHAGRVLKKETLEPLFSHGTSASFIIIIHTGLHAHSFIYHRRYIKAVLLQARTGS
jgi:hypothetical protein